MKRVLFLAAFLAITAASAASYAQSDRPVITTDDHHEFVSADRDTLTFQDEMNLEIYYKNSPSRQLSKISVECLKHRKSMSFDQTYFALPILPVLDTRHDQNGHLKRAYFQLSMKTDRTLKDPDRLLTIDCTEDKIEVSIMSEEIVR